MSTTIASTGAPDPQQQVEVDDDESTSWSAADENKLVRKLDFRIFPVIIILFILNFIDRNNFANARLKASVWRGLHRGYAILNPCRDWRRT